MEFSCIGTIAVPYESHHNINSLKDLHFTSTVAHDIASTFQKAQNILDNLEQNSTGTMKDFDLLYTLVEWLPYSSDERLECNFRIQSIKEEWGTDSHNSRTKKITDKDELPLPVSNVEKIMIEKNHVEFINSGKVARRWIIEQLSSSATKEFSTNEEVVSVVDEQLQLLGELLNIVITSDNNNAVVKAFHKLRLQSFEQSNAEIQHSIITKWINTSRNQINTLTQLNLEIDELAKQVLSENQSPILSTLNYDQFRE